ncbi:MAG: RNA 3'-terminal phosphate cyclase [Candidatus Bilamarchaeaceae archaeon]
MRSRRPAPSSLPPGGSIIEIDGSFGEGGGQIIRTSLSLSAITGKPVRISRIRANRPNPGLQMQHLTSVKAVRNICRGTVEGAELGSEELVFNPGKIVGGKYDFDIGTAGSTVLVAQTLLPILLFAEKKSEVGITGGTHVMKSPSYDYFEKVFLPALSLFGINASCSMEKPGFYPRGGGHITFSVSPGQPNPVTIFPKSEIISVLIRLSDLPMSIAIREKKIFVQNNIEKNLFVREKPPALDQGNSVFAWAGFRGSYVLGQKGIRAEQVASECLSGLKRAMDFDVDEHLADQLLLYGALAAEEGNAKTEYSIPEITEHLRTNAEIIRKFLPERRMEIGAGSVVVGS